MQEKTDRKKRMCVSSTTSRLLVNFSLICKLTKWSTGRRVCLMPHKPFECWLPKYLTCRWDKRERGWLSIICFEWQRRDEAFSVVTFTSFALSSLSVYELQPHKLCGLRALNLVSALFTDEKWWAWKYGSDESSRGSNEQESKRGAWNVVNQIMVDITYIIFIHSLLSASCFTVVSPPVESVQFIIENFRLG